MIKCRMSDGTFIFGVDRENMRRLRDKKPLMINLKPLGGTDNVIIMYGTTYADIIHDLEQTFGPLPQAQIDPTAKDKGD